MRLDKWRSASISWGRRNGECGPQCRLVDLDVPSGKGPQTISRSRRVQPGPIAATVGAVHGCQDAPRHAGARKQLVAFFGRILQLAARPDGVKPEGRKRMCICAKAEKQIHHLRLSGKADNANLKQESSGGTRRAQRKIASSKRAVYTRRSEVAYLSGPKRLLLQRQFEMKG